MSQSFWGSDTTIEYEKIDRVRLRLSRVGVGTTYTIKVGIQRPKDVNYLEPDGVYLASGTVDPADLEVLKDGGSNGQDVYVNVPLGTIIKDSESDEVLFEIICYFFVCVYT